MKRFALVGNPNCGKTTLFNSLTGSSAHVGNWPGVTVEKKVGQYKKCKEPVEIVDLPGIYSLSPYTSEEVISRNFILDDKPDCIINIIDATNLERNLYLTTQLLEIDIPMVVALNMMDVVKKNGDVIDANYLSKQLGIPVAGISAQKSDNLDVLMEMAYQESTKQRPAHTVLEGTNLAHLIMDCKSAFSGLKVDNPLFHAVKLIELDELEVKNHPDLIHIVDEFKKEFKDDPFGSDLEAIVADERYKYITKNYTKAQKKKMEFNPEFETRSDKIDKVLTSVAFGIPIFLFILFLVFHLTFSENLFFLGGLFADAPVNFSGTIFEGLFWTEAGINSPGVILFNLVDCLSSSFTDLVAGWLSQSPSWVSGLICDGILGGLFAVLSFVPQILVLFLFFSILEDTGYMARIAFILDRIFRKFGLSGRAFIPMIMGFGCSIPAMINTRTLADENERTATIRVIPFFSCGAKLPILTAIAGAMCQTFNFSSVDVITFSMYLVGIATAIVAIILMRHTIMRGEVSPFIMELPAYHLPQGKALCIHLWDKLKHFIQKAFTVILASTIVIWFLQSFTFRWTFIEQANAVDITMETFDGMMEDADFNNRVIALNGDYDSEEPVTFDVILSDLEALEEETELSLDDETIKESYVVLTNEVFEASLTNFLSVTGDEDYTDTSDSILAGFGQLAQPLFTPLGFGSNLNENGWVYGVSAVTGLIAKENVVATFAVLSQCASNSSTETVEDFKNVFYASYDDEGINASTQMIVNSGVGDHWGILIAFIVFNITTIPCFAAVASAKAELTKKKFKNTIIFWLVTSYTVSMMAYLILTWYWTIFIFIPIFILAGFGLHYFNKLRDKKKIVGD